MDYNSSMKTLKTSFKHFLIFSFFIILPCATGFADPGPEVPPPLPFDQDSQGDSSEYGKPPAPQGDFRRPPLPPRDQDNIINFRGNRTYTENLPLKINQTRCERKADDVVCVEIIFNQTINPRSLHRDSFFINNAPLPLGTRFTFNKKGNTIKILVLTGGNSFKLKVQKICSFDGSVIEPVEILAEVER